MARFSAKLFILFQTILFIECVKNKKCRNVQTHKYGYSTKHFPAPQRKRSYSLPKEDKFNLTRKFKI